MTIQTAVKERRQCPRIDFEGHVMIRTGRHPGFVPCQPYDVSLGGMRLRLDEDVELRSEVEVQLVAAPAAQPIQCHGRVSWTTARLDVREQPPIPYDIGIEFVGLSPQIRSALARLIDAWRQELRPARPPASTATVLIRIGDLTLQAHLNSTLSAAAVLQALPMTSIAHRWGDELYWASPLTAVAVPESPTQDVEVGDIGYWLEGQSLCLFFGRTPASIDHRPRPMVPVNIVGRCALDERLRAMHDGTPVELRRT